MVVNWSLGQREPSTILHNIQLQLNPLANGLSEEIIVLNPKQLKDFQQQLLRDKAELEATLSDKTNKADETVELDQSRVGRLSRIDAMQAQQMALEMTRRKQLQLTKINGALTRIEQGTFGHCFVCGTDIDIRRLQLDPTITRCVSCQSS